MPKIYTEDDFIDKPNPTMWERFSAGFSGKEISQPQGFDMGDIAQFVGENALPTAGAMIGGLAGPGGAIAGAMAGKAMQKGVTQTIGAFKPGFAPKESVIKTIADVGITGALEGAGQGAMALGKAIMPTIKTAISQVMHGMAGIPQKTAKKVLDNPDILKNAVSVDEAGKIFESTIKNAGMEYGPKAVEKVTGDIMVSDSTTRKLLNDTLKRIKQLEGYNKINGKRVYLEDMPENAQAVKDLTQQALAARYELSKMLKAAKWGDPKLRAEEANILEKMNGLDDWLENRVPGFSNAREIYSFAKIKDEFNSLFPRKKNLSADAVRMMLAAGGATTALATGTPSGLIGVAAMSPKAWEYGIRGATSTPIKYGAEAIKPIVRASVLSLSNPLSSSTEQLMRKHYEAQKVKILIYALLLMPNFALGQWCPVKVTSIQSIQENFRRASLYSNRKLDKFANDTLYGNLTFNSEITISTSIIFNNVSKSAWPVLLESTQTFTGSNTFSQTGAGGTTISSATITSAVIPTITGNTNFSGTTSTTTFAGWISLSGAAWVVNDCFTATTCVALCAAGKFALIVGCDAPQSSIRKQVSNADANLVAGSQGAYCQAAAAGTNFYASALCVNIKW